MRLSASARQSCGQLWVTHDEPLVVGFGQSCISVGSERGAQENNKS